MSDGLLPRPLRDFPWLPPQRVRQFERFGLATVEDLLSHFPKRHEDRRTFDHFPRGESEQPVCVCGNVLGVSVKRLRGGRTMVEVTLEEALPHALSPRLICRWFNVYHIQKMIASGHRLVVFGKPKTRGGKLFIDHPEFEIVEGDGEETSIHLNRITPVYRLTEGITQRMVRGAIFRALAALDLPRLSDRLPKTLDALGYGAALKQIHFPDSWEEKEAARRHLVLNEFFAMQLFIGAKRAETVARPGRNHCGSGALLERFLTALPFPLTGAQKRAIAEIRRDLAATRPMNRLLHGDVGAGKTLVALAAMLLCVEAGYQAALMAPTQILAEQHYLNFKRWLGPLGLGIALRTGSRQTDSAMPLFDEAAWLASVVGQGERPASPGGPQIVIGTHALLYEGAGLNNLGLAVIDEQHKFGVMQRARLIDQASAPDVLVMSATPIPRTLTMTVYGDLDVSMLDEMPAHRGRVVTALRESAKLPEIVAFLRKELEGGRQAFVVYPLIEESAKLEAKAAAQEFEKWKTLLAPMRCALIHGRVHPDEKDAVMEKFRVGEVQALIATSVIEVGIDVPNATIMLIENAERFGLAQLHQLRGRIGRGRHKSYCILISDAVEEEARRKLETMVETGDGFKIAEADLELRGPGDILGTSQSGLPPLKLGNLLADREWMRAAREAVTKLFQKDPSLSAPEHRAFRELITEQRKLILSQVS